MVVFWPDMPRPPRIEFPDAVYHVTSRGNGRDEPEPGSDLNGTVIGRRFS